MERPKSPNRTIEPRIGDRDSRASAVRPDRRFDLCAFCPDLCLDRCPVVDVTGSTSLSPHAKMLSGWLATHRVVEPDPDLARLAYQCTGCLACHEVCEHRVDVASALFSLRADWVRSGISPYDRRLFERPGGSRADRDPEPDLVAAQARLIPRRYFVPEAQAVLFAGCHAILGQPQVVRDALAVFRALDIEFVGASEDAAVCCGYPLYAGGLLDDFVRHAERVSRALHRYRHVVALSACCAYTMKVLYPQVGIENPPRVLTALELAAPLAQRAKAPSLGLALAYHDSCFLGRLSGLYDLPREVLTHLNGMPPIELRLAREEAPCCGSGGAFERIAPAESRAAAQRVIAMASDAGADLLVSACTRCSDQLGLASGGDHGVRVLDLFQVLAEWLRGAEKPRRPHRT